jgi:hypothetical protein
MKKSILIISLIALLPQSAAAEWVRVTDGYIFRPEMAEAEACQQAEARASAKAVRQVSGETLWSEEAMRCTEQGDVADCARNSTVWTKVGGDIRSTRDYDRKVETIMVGVETFRNCVVSFEADVYVAEGKPDPDFDVGVALNNTVYRDGEKLMVTLKSSQPMAVQIFQWLPYEKGDAQVGRIFPNAFDAADRIAAKSVTIPTEAGGKRYDLKVSFPAGQPPSRKMVDEYLMVVATKKPMMALRDSYSLDDFNRVVAEIPLGDRRIVRRLYNIVRGGE